MPAQDRLGPYQQSRPSRARKVGAQGGQNHPVAGIPMHPLDLTLENLNLAAESQHLSLETGLIAVARRDHVQQDAYQRIQQRPYHPGAKS